MPIDVVIGRERTQQSQVVKQADVVALLALLPDEFPGAAVKANFRYYEPRCAHGSSLSARIHALVGARLGETETALRFLRQAAGPRTLNWTRTVPAAYGSPDWGVCGRR
jgi:trehalose/maltose hydrolase-like predicted phosphorylase